MKKILIWIRAHKILTAIGVVLIGGFVYAAVRPAAPTVEYVTERAEIRTIRQTVSATGAVAVDTSVDLTFAIGGEVAEITVAVGDSVEEGQIVASLKNTALTNRIREAQAAVAAQQANLQRVVEGARDAEVRVSFVAYQNAQNEYDALRTKLEAEKAAYAVEVRNAQKALDDALVSTELAVTNARQSLLLSIQKSLNAARQAIQTTDEVTNSNEIGSGFGLNDQSAKFFTETILDEISVDVSAAQAALVTAQASGSVQSLAGAVDAMQAVLDRTGELVSYAIAAVEGTLRIGVYTSARQSADINTLQAEQASVDAVSLELAVKEQAYASARTEQPITINARQATLNSAEAKIAQAVATHDYQLSQAQAAIETARAQYDLARASASNAEIAVAQAQVTQAQAALDALRSQMEDYQIIAPYSGDIAKVSVKANEAVAAGRPVVTLVGEGVYEVKVDISESDIAKLAFGNTALTTLDAYGDDVVFEGTVMSIDRAETIIQDVVYYKVTLSLDPLAYEVKNGMTANVDIATNQRDNVIVIPQRAVLSDEAGRYVRILMSDGSVVRAMVTTGLRGDGGRIEITSGLAQGDEVIVFEREL